jgi:hypothetical protein
MMMSKCSRPDGRGATAAVLILSLAATGACTSTSRFTGTPSEQVDASPPPQPATPPLLQPPPIDLAGRWRLSMVGGTACLMAFTDTPGAAEGSIAPTGGCPANFFTSRKWTFEHDTLIIRDHKGEALAELSFAAGRFEGRPAGGSGGSITLARP